MDKLFNFMKKLLGSNKGLEKAICSAPGCDFEITPEHGCRDDQNREYCGPNCAYFALEKEGIKDPIESVYSLEKH